jgi:hypothetical protein
MKKLISIIIVMLGLSISFVGIAKEVVDRELVAQILLLGEPLGSAPGGKTYPNSIMIAIRYNNMLYMCFVQNDNDSGAVAWACNDPYQ